jgi:hypothetical protein
MVVRPVRFTVVAHCAAISPSGPAALETARNHALRVMWKVSSTFARSNSREVRKAACRAEVFSSTTIQVISARIRLIRNLVSSSLSWSIISWSRSDRERGALKSMEFFKGACGL